MDDRLQEVFDKFMDEHYEIKLFHNHLFIDKNGDEFGYLGGNFFRDTFIFSNILIGQTIYMLFNGSDVDVLLKTHLNKKFPNARTRHIEPYIY